MLRPLRPHLIAALVLLAGPYATGVVYAQAQGRVQATVLDENGNPIQGVEVTVTSDEVAFDEHFTTDKKGRFSIIFVDATLTYNFKFVKDGYRTTVTPLKPKVGQNLRQEFTVPSNNAPAGSGEPAPAAEAAKSKNPAINVFNEGVTAFQAGDLETAKQKFHEAIEMSPDLVQPYSALAGIYLDGKDYEQAAAMANKVLELQPDDTRALRVLYDADRGLGKDAEAEEVLKKLKTLDKGGTDTAIRIFNEGAEAARLGDLETAKKRFHEALEVDPELAAAYAALATVELTQSHYAEALTAADKALELDPGRPEVLRSKFWAYRGLGDEAKAAEVFQELMTVDPQGTAKSLFDRGVEMFNAGNVDGARAAFEQALQADPKNAKAHYMMALCLINNSENAKAKEQLQKFLELAPDDPDAGLAREMLKSVG